MTAVVVGRGGSRNMIWLPIGILEWWNSRVHLVTH